MQQMRAASADAKLAGFEIAKQIILDPEMWSVENNLLTPTFKMKRVELKKRWGGLPDLGSRVVSCTSSHTSPAYSSPLVPAHELLQRPSSVWSRSAYLYSHLARYKEQFDQLYAAGPPSAPSKL